MTAISKLAESWMLMYAFLYVGAAVLGMGLTWFAPILSMVLMLFAAAICIVAILVENKWLRLALGLLWAVGAMANWMHVIPWTPAYSDFQYTVMAVLDMAQSVALISLSEVFS